jgi:hypothetical protein
MYKVMNSVAGFVNHFFGIAARPNAILAWHADAPLGQRSLVIRLLTSIKLDAEILINYGPAHTCKDPKSLGQKKRKKLTPSHSCTVALLP